MTQAGVLAVTGSTALQAVEDHGRVRPGDQVLVLGASGGVGTYAVQIADALGGIVTGVASTDKLDLVRGLGASRVIDYRTDDPLAEPHRYDVIIDTGGNRRLGDLRRALTPTGTLVIVGGENGGRWVGGTDRQIRARLTSLVTRQRLTTFVAREDAGHLERLADLVETGHVTPVVDRTYPLAESADAITPPRERTDSRQDRHRHRHRPPRTSDEDDRSARLESDAVDQPLWRVEGDETPLVDQRQPVGEPLGFLHEVRHEQHGRAAVTEFLDQPPGLAPGLRVEARGQFVEDHRTGSSDERDCDRQTLLLSARQIGVPRPGLVGETEALDPFRGVHRIRIERSERLHHLSHLHAILESALLQLDSEQVTHLGPVPQRVEPEHLDAARIRRAQSRDRLDGGRLARPVRAENREDLPLVHGERDTIDDDLVGVGLGELTDFDDRHRGALLESVAVRRAGPAKP